MYVGIPVVPVPDDLPRMSIPVYRTPRGHARQITGRAAETWPAPREFQTEDGDLFVERPMPHKSGWGASHGTTWKRTFVGEFMAQYVEGRSSGFPFWPVLYYAARVTWLYRILRRPTPPC